MSHAAACHGKLLTSLTRARQRQARAGRGRAPAFTVVVGEVSWRPSGTAGGSENRQRRSSSTCAMASSFECVNVRSEAFAPIAWKRSAAPP